MTEPAREFTPWRGRFNGDVIVGKTTASLVRMLPLTGFDGRGLQPELNLGFEIAEVLNEIGRTSKSYGRRRPSDPAGRYRHVKLMSVRVPTALTPPRQQRRELAVAQRPWLAGITTTATVAAVAVHLRERTGLHARRAKDAVHEGARSIAIGSITPARVEKDRREMLTATSRAGCYTPSEDDWRMLLGWYTRGGVSNPPVIYHFDHIHIFSPAGWQDLSFEKESGAVATLDDCCDWPADLAGHHVIAFGCVTSFTGTSREDGFDDSAVALSVLDQRVQWVSAAHDAGAWACTSTFYLEPGKVTAKMLEDNRTRVDNDMERVASKGKWQKDEHQRQMEHVADARNVYGSGGKSAAINVSGLIAMPLEWPWHEGLDWASSFSHVGITVSPVQTEYMIREAFIEMQLGSDQMTSPQPGELSTEWLGFSNFSVATVPSERKGIFLGLSVEDRQPCWLDLDEGFNLEKLPLHILQAASGGGKSTMMGEIITEATIEGRPGLVGNFKPRDTTYKLQAERLSKMGFPVAYYAMDHLAGFDGPFDPFKLRDPKNPTVMNPAAAQRATWMIMKVHPWSQLDKTPPRAEQRLTGWLTDGMRRGARCVGEALSWHLDDGPEYTDDVPAAAIIGPILAYARDDAMFRTYVGLDPESPGWASSNGLTIVERGYSALPFPRDGSTYETWSMGERAAAVFMSSFIESASYGLAYRRGFLALDEVWVVEGIAPGELANAGRTWRQFRIYTLITNQRMTDIEHLKQYAQRVSVGYNDSEIEAAAALRAAGATVTPTQIEAMKLWAFQKNEDGSVRCGAKWLHLDVAGRLALIEQIPNPAWQITSAEVEADQNG